MTFQHIFGTLLSHTTKGEGPIVHISGDIITALNEEKNALSSMPKSALLTNGICACTRNGRSYYRFEIPDNFYLSPGITVQGSVGTKLRYAFPMVVADVQSQFGYFVFPAFMGELIPEIHCTWDPSEIVTRLYERWSSLSPNTLMERLISRSVGGTATPFSREPIFPSTFTPSQRDALKSSLSRPISFVIGERHHGKTGVAAALLFNMIREGKRVLYLASSSNGLYNCMNEAVSLNSVIAEESIAIVDTGLDLQPELPVVHYAVDGLVDPQHAEALKKLFTIIFAEHEYARVDEYAEKIREKQRQIEEAVKEVDIAKSEAVRLLNLSMIDKMKLRNHKTVIEDAQAAVQHKIALVERLKRHIAMLTKEQFRKETTLPVSLKERKSSEQALAVAAGFTSLQSSAEKILSRRCVATTLPQALMMDPSMLAGFDVVCVDDAHALNLPEFLYCASLASERCYVLADITEQPPQSVAQTALSRTWLQRNYFAYFRNSDNDDNRFTAGSFPPDTVSELLLPDRTQTIFETCLFHVLDGAPFPPATKGRIYFINTEDLHATSPQFIGKKKILPYNETNAKKVIDCAKHAMINGAMVQSDIIVVTPPSGQSMYLREQFRAFQMRNVEIATLGALRLCSKRALIFDLTVAGLDFTLRMLDEKKTGLVKVADTFNSLLSTVRDDLYVVADLSYFQTRYKGRFVTKLLETMASRSENSAGVTSASRRFDDLDSRVRKRVLFASSMEKSESDYRSAVEGEKSSVLDASKQPPNTIAVTERKQRSDLHFACLRVLAKREFINTIAQYLETVPLYKTTTETQNYASVLPEYDCENENDFKAIMDMWNLLIYETSNAHKTEHPLAVKAKVDAKISSDIQQIYVYYHTDLEMVVEEGKHKLAQSMQKIFNDCIGKKPVTPADWKNAYLVFLGRMEKYLDTVINQIRV